MIYVGPLEPCEPTAHYEWREGCRLSADYEAELHDFAERLGLRRAWFRWVQPLGVPHYMLTDGMAGRAVKLGARRIGADEEARRAAAFRASVAMERATGSLFGAEETGRML